MSLDAWITLSGGILIGIASAALLVFNGRIFGVSGLVGGLLAPFRKESAWRWAAVLGLLVGGVLLRRFYPEAFDLSSQRPTGLVIVAGLLVGFGTRMGSGCTSGHGICGMGRLSRRSIVATLVFVATGMLTATLVHLLGGVS